MSVRAYPYTPNNDGANNDEEMLGQLPEAHAQLAASCETACRSPTCSGGYCAMLEHMATEESLLAPCACMRNNRLRSCKRRIWRSSELSTLVLLHSALGNKWSAIAKYLQGRSDNDCKNIFYSALRSKTSQTNRLLRTYAQAVGPNCDDPLLRQAAYKTARQQLAARAGNTSALGRNGTGGAAPEDEPALYDNDEDPAAIQLAAAAAAATRTDSPPPTQGHEAAGLAPPPAAAAGAAASTAATAPAVVSAGALSAGTITLTSGMTSVPVNGGRSGLSRQCGPGVLKLEGGGRRLSYQAATHMPLTPACPREPSPPSSDGADGTAGDMASAGGGSVSGGTMIILGGSSTSRLASVSEMGDAGTSPTDGHSSQAAAGGSQSQRPTHSAATTAPINLPWNIGTSVGAATPITSSSLLPSHGHSTHSQQYQPHQILRSRHIPYGYKIGITPPTATSSASEAPSPSTAAIGSSVTWHPASGAGLAAGAEGSPAGSGAAAGSPALPPPQRRTSNTAAGVQEDLVMVTPLQRAAGREGAVTTGGPLGHLSQHGSHQQMPSWALLPSSLSAAAANAAASDAPPDAGGGRQQRLNSEDSTPQPPAAVAAAAAAAAAAAFHSLPAGASRPHVLLPAVSTGGLVDSGNGGGAGGSGVYSGGAMCGSPAVVPSGLMLTGLGGHMGAIHLQPAHPQQLIQGWGPAAGASVASEGSGHMMGSPGSWGGANAAGSPMGPESEDGGALAQSAPTQQQPQTLMPPLSMPLQQQLQQNMQMQQLLQHQNAQLLQQLRQQQQIALQQRQLYSPGQQPNLQSQDSNGSNITTNNNTPATATATPQQQILLYRQHLNPQQQHAQQLVPSRHDAWSIARGSGGALVSSSGPFPASFAGYPSLTPQPQVQTADQEDTMTMLRSTPPLQQGLPSQIGPEENNLMELWLSLADAGEPREEGAWR